jgi:CheY-like chemotaxis protein
MESHMHIKIRATSQAGWPGERPQPQREVLETGWGKRPAKRAPAHRGALRVLVADDDADTTRSLCLLVGLWGYDTRGASEGREALKLALAYRPDVLLLDIAMPGMNGYDLARRLREEGRFEDALLVALTGYADEGHRLLGLAAGFDHYLVKPVDPSTIRQMLGVERDRLAGSQERDPSTEFRVE